MLNDGILPALSGVSNDSLSQWANELFTMRRSGTHDIVLSVEVPSDLHNRIELSVFNCPQLGIYAPQVVVYTADSQMTNLAMVANASLPDTSCDYLWNFCVLFSGGTSIPNLNLVFPYQNNSTYVFLGEVTFFNDPVNDQCSSPELITMQQTLPPPPIG